MQKLTEKVHKLREDNLHSYRFAAKDAKTRVVTRPRAKTHQDYRWPNADGVFDQLITFSLKTIVC